MDECVGFSLITDATAGVVALLRPYEIQRLIHDTDHTNYTLLAIYHLAHPPNWGGVRVISLLT